MNTTEFLNTLTEDEKKSIVTEMFGRKNGMKLNNDSILFTKAAELSKECKIYENVAITVIESYIYKWSCDIIYKNKDMLN